MNGRMDDFDLVDTVAPKALSAYVEARGWKKTEPFGDLGASYSRGDGGVEVFVPTSRRLADFAIRTWETAGAIAEVEKRSRSEVLRDLLCADADRARIQLPKTQAGGALPIGDAERIIRESRNMLTAAACSASRPQPAFGAQDHKRALRHVEGARLSQTEGGGIVISLPTAVRASTDGGADDEPFARRSTRKLASGLKAMREAADFARRESDFSAFEEGAADGVSANLCDSVAKMVGKRNPVDIEISVTWALALPPPEESGAPIWFGGDDARILDEASRFLKKLHESRQII